VALVDPLRHIQAILQHTGPLPRAAATPRGHFVKSMSAVWNLLNYIEDKVESQPHVPAVYRRHMRLLHAMIFINLVEVFERFLKELAAVCVDAVAPFVLDKRFSEFQVRGHDLAAHFAGGTLGKALCESDTWLDCEGVNDRFRKVLADPFEAGKFFAFPQRGQDPASERHRFQPMSIVFQLRHTIVHNVGVVTSSDAVKLRLVSQVPVDAGRLIRLERDDVRHAKQFLDDTAKSLNDRVGVRLAELMTNLRQNHGMAINPLDTANSLTGLFGLVLTVDGIVGTLPPP
jgi:hypothetical protein